MKNGNLSCQKKWDLSYMLSNMLISFRNSVIRNVYTMTVI